MAMILSAPAASAAFSGQGAKTPKLFICGSATAWSIRSCSKEGWVTCGSPSPKHWAILKEPAGHHRWFFVHVHACDFATNMILDVLYGTVFDLRVAKKCLLGYRFDGKS